MGIVLLFLPYLGIPDTTKKLLTILIGIAVIIFSIKLRHGYKKLKFQLRRVEEPQQSSEVIHG